MAKKKIALKDKDLCAKKAKHVAGGGFGCGAQNIASTANSANTWTGSVMLGDGSVRFVKPGP